MQGSTSLRPASTDWTCSGVPIWITYSPSPVSTGPIFHGDEARDLRFSRFVAWTSNSSMEVVVKMSGVVEGGGWHTPMLGRFTMVCRDARTHGARRVPPLIVETVEERVLWDIGQGEFGGRGVFEGVPTLIASD